MATVNQQIDALLKRGNNPKKRAVLTRQGFADVVSKSAPFGKLADFSSIRTQKARLLKGFQEIGISKSTSASIVDSAQAQQAQRNRDGRALYLSGNDLLKAAQRHGLLIDDIATNPARKSRKVTLVAANPLSSRNLAAPRKKPRENWPRFVVEEQEGVGPWMPRASFRIVEDAEMLARAIHKAQPSIAVRVIDTKT